MGTQKPRWADVQIFDKQGLAVVNMTCSSTALRHSVPSCVGFVFTKESFARQSREYLHFGMAEALRQR